MAVAANLWPTKASRPIAPGRNAAALQAFNNNPGYQFQQQQGNNAINAQSAATGQNGGNQSIALANYNQGLAGSTYQNAVSNLMPCWWESATCRPWKSSPRWICCAKTCRISRSEL